MTAKIPATYRFVFPSAIVRRTRGGHSSSQCAWRKGEAAAQKEHASWRGGGGEGFERPQKSLKVRTCAKFGVCVCRK